MYCFRPALSKPVACSFERGREAIQTSFQAGGMASRSMRSIVAGSRISRPRPPRERNDPLRPVLVGIFSGERIYTGRRMRDENVIVVLEGDQTGQELLEEAVRVLASDVIGVELEFPRFDLSIEARRETENRVVHEAAAAIREHGLGLKAATVTPETRGDVGSPNRILREEIGGKVIVRTGRRIPGVARLRRSEEHTS